MLRHTVYALTKYVQRSHFTLTLSQTLTLTLTLTLTHNQFNVGPLHDQVESVVGQFFPLLREGTPVFLAPQKLTLPNSNSIRNAPKCSAGKQITSTITHWLIRLTKQAFLISNMAYSDALRFNNKTLFHVFAQLWGHSDSFAPIPNSSRLSGISWTKREPGKDIRGNFQKRNKV